MHILENFTWEVAAKATLSAYHSALEIEHRSDLFQYLHLAWKNVLIRQNKILYISACVHFGPGQTKTQRNGEDI